MMFSGFVKVKFSFNQILLEVDLICSPYVIQVETNHLSVLL